MSARTTLRPTLNTLRPALSRLRPAPDHTAERGLVSDLERQRPMVRLATRALNVLLLGGLAIAALGPLAILFKSAISPTQDTIRNPLQWFPSGVVQWGNLANAWSVIELDRYLGNTLIQATGSALATLIVATTGGYVLSILRPRWAGFVQALVLASLLIPVTVTLVPLYLNILKVPGLGVSLLNTHWAIVLPAGANAFSVLIVKRFFDSIPRELIEAARVDGAGSLRVFVSIVLPLSRPIMSVVLLLQFVASWKDYLWPLLVLQDPAVQPLSVAIPKVAERVELSLQMAALSIAVIVPIIVLLVFQRQIIRAVGATSGVKG